MAELGLILSIASLLQLSGKVLTNCIDYVDKVKNAPSDISKIIDEVSGLEFILKRLSNLATSDESDDRLASLKALHERPSGPFNACNEILGEIAKRLEKISGSGVLRRRLMWPFEGGKLEELLAGLEKHKSTFMVALTGDSFVEVVRTSEAISKIGSKIDDLKAREERAKIAEWLRGADPSTNHNSARKKHEPGTGEWLLNLQAFETWRDCEGGILWLSGIPGAGKTVLSSTVVEHLKEKENIGGTLRPKIAYFYFDFNDHVKQTAQGCIQSLVRQLFEQSDHMPQELRSLYIDSGHGAPSLDNLVEVLIAMLNQDTLSFIVIDALDECRADEEEQQRDYFYEALRGVESKVEGNYKIFIASRPEMDIKRVMAELGSTEVNVENSLVDEDIRSHVRALLPKELRFKKWPEPVKKEIEDALVKQSNGM
jgi:ankyrin repeat domain-containing protein 50